MQPCENAPDVESSDTKNRIRLISKQRKERSEDNIFANNPFLEDLLEWRDSSEGKQAMEISDVLRLLLKDVQLDAKGRNFIWREAEQLDLDQSVQRPVTGSRTICSIGSKRATTRRTTLRHN